MHGDTSVDGFQLRRRAVSSSALFSIDWCSRHRPQALLEPLAL